MVYASFMTRPIAFDMRSHSRALDGQLPASGRRQAVVLGAPAELRHRPFGFDPAPMLEAMQGRVERALVDLEHVFGDLLDALGDRPPVLRILLERAQDQQVERAGKQVGGAGHGVDCRHYRTVVSTVNTKGCRRFLARWRRRFEGVVPQDESLAHHRSAGPLTAIPRAARRTGRSLSRGARAAMPPSVPPPSAAA